ncbi:MAG: DUF2905 domain-containing protein [Ignavibacteriales bacterium]|nr:DUF2905 domain-containing protein [Ignavibacteriales bacterium]
MKYSLFKIITSENITDYIFWKRLDLNPAEIDLQEGQRVEYFNLERIRKTKLAFNYNKVLEEFFSEIVKMSNTQKILIAAGILILIIGFLWPWIAKLPIGKLPGDIVVDKPNFKFFFPITSMILVSVIISLIIWLIKKFY